MAHNRHISQLDSNGYTPFVYRNNRQLLGIHELNAYRLYELIKGGFGQIRGTTEFTESGRRQLMELAGVSRQVLSMKQLNDLFIEIDNWERRPSAVELPAGKTVLCNNCNCNISAVPCLPCKAAGMGANLGPTKLRNDA